MLKEYRRCRQNSRNFFHKMDRAVTAHLIANERFEELPLFESIYAHQRRVGDDWGDATTRGCRGYSMKAVDRCITKFIGKPYNDLRSFIGKALEGKERNDAIRHIESVFQVEYDFVWPYLHEDFFVDEDGICRSRR
jgi:hypothetical protein